MKKILQVQLVLTAVVIFGCIGLVSCRKYDLAPISTAEPEDKLGLSTAKRNWLADLPAEELPKQAVELYNLYPSDMWRELLIPLAYDEETDVTLYGVVSHVKNPEDDRIALRTDDMQPAGVVLRCGNRTVYHPIDWGGNLVRDGNPELYTGDFDGDGNPEAAVQLLEGWGTGCLVYQLYIFELDTLSYSVPDASTLKIDMTYNPETYQATLTGGEQRLTVEVPEPFRELKYVGVGNEISFSCEDGQLYFHAGVDFYFTMAYLADLKAPVIYRDGGYCIGEVESLTETKY